METFRYDPFSAKKFGQQTRGTPGTLGTPDQEDPAAVLRTLREEQTLRDLPPWRKAMYACIAIMLVIVLVFLVALVVNWFTLRRRLDVYRWCVDLEGGASVLDALPTGGDPNATGYGLVQVDTHGGVLEWELVVSGLNGLATELKIRGPLDPPNETLVSTSVYADLGVANKVNVVFKGALDISIAKSKRVAHKSHFYYVRLDTAAYPNGAVRGRLGQDCWINEKP